MPNNPPQWLELDDSDTTAAALQAELDARVIARASYQQPAPHFPSFGYISPMPQPRDGRFAPNLFHHLRQLNDAPQPPTAANLAASPATRLPIVGTLWRQIRGQVHNLVLFYVNRFAEFDQQRHSHLLNIVNELTGLAQAQQAEIERLQARIAALEEE